MAKYEVYLKDREEPLTITAEQGKIGGMGEYGTVVFTDAAGKFIAEFFQGAVDGWVRSETDETPEERDRRTQVSR